MAAIEVKFPQGKRVDAHMKGFVIETDQPPYGGGEGSAPAPFDLFLASLATCAGIYVLSFCESKGIDKEGIAFTMDMEKDKEKGKISKIIFQLTLPSHFPQKYEQAILRSIDLCAVKKHIQDPPSFETVIERRE